MWEPKQPREGLQGSADNHKRDLSLLTLCDKPGNPRDLPEIPTNHMPKAQFQLSGTGSQPTCYIRHGSGKGSFPVSIRVPRKTTRFQEMVQAVLMASDIRSTVIFRFSISAYMSCNSIPHCRSLWPLYGPKMFDSRPLKYLMLNQCFGGRFR